MGTSRCCTISGTWFAAAAAAAAAAAVVVQGAVCAVCPFVIRRLLRP